MDELRDHRFYTEDMIHPNEQAIHHIWTSFRDNCLDQSARKISDEVLKLKKRINHDLMFPGTRSSAEFEEETKRMIDSLRAKYSYIKL